MCDCLLSAAVVCLVHKVPVDAQSSREELLEDIEELKKKVTGATEKAIE